VDKILDANQFTRKQRQEMRLLKEEVLHGTVSDPFSGSGFSLHALDSDSRRMWQEELPSCRGKSWLDLPFYLAESLLYFKILTAIGYFDASSSYYMRDPYKVFKREELCSVNGGLAIGHQLCETLEELGNPDERLRVILHNSLWGNRVDLSLFSIAEKSRDRVLDERGENLLIDQSKRLVELLDAASRIDIILDNTGQELVSDLIAVWHLLTMMPDRAVHMHAKLYPFYVSDAMVPDIDETVDALCNDRSVLLQSIGLGLRSFHEEGRLHLGDHYFWTGPRHYPELPSDLVRELSRADVVLLKGDINYRRIIADRKWDVSKNLEDIACYFPATIALLRTMKSEAIVDIDEDHARKLDVRDPDWKVNGERGIIRVVERRPPYPHTLL
jgi:uncharacterized protein with ATP-grasp and redox domains